jgi:hypothetical protein
VAGTMATPPPEENPSTKLTTIKAASVSTDRLDGEGERMGADGWGRGGSDTGRLTSGASRQ